MKNLITGRIDDLRKAMRNNNLDALYFSGTDPHCNEYLCDHWQVRRFLTGFTGSYGEVVITLNHAGLWTDTRYFLQAADELSGTGVALHHLRVPDAIPVHRWLALNLSKGSRVGIDPFSLPFVTYQLFRDVFEMKNMVMVSLPDLLPHKWKNRPPLPANPVFELALPVTGAGREEKNEMINAELSSHGADLTIISALDDLAWTYNLRGNDIPYNPLFFGFAVTGMKGNRLFVRKASLPSGLYGKLQQEGVTVSDYDEFYDHLLSLADKTVYVDPGQINTKIWLNLSKNCRLIEGTSIPALLKSVKNETELKGFREAMKKDGAALVQFLFWLSRVPGDSGVTEYTAGRKLAELRAMQPDFMGESFDPNIGYKAHGAVVHLHVCETNAIELKPEGILLFDSGGHYMTGTTDVTRTVALGPVTDQQKSDFTLSLKGMIALSSAVFPKGTKGIHLDILARKPLWENGLNYGHGTGHGVGHFLNVHEGPASIRQEFNPHEIKPGMVFSNEPGLYREGEYGVRTENMMVCVEKRDTRFGRFLGFETLTLCPIDTSLVMTQLMSEAELKWLNDYNLHVREQLRPLLDDEHNRFLFTITQPAGHPVC